MRVARTDINDETIREIFNELRRKAHGFGAPKAQTGAWPPGPNLSAFSEGKGHKVASDNLDEIKTLESLDDFGSEMEKFKFCQLFLLRFLVAFLNENSFIAKIELELKSKGKLVLYEFWNIHKSQRFVQVFVF